MSWIGRITASPVFPELRLDEQVRFLDLRDRFGEWRRGGLEPEASSELLWDTVAFADQLLEINQRRDLAAFDHKLLLWALAEMGGRGMTEEIMTRLESQRGRDRALDTVLDHRTSPSRTFYRGPHVADGPYPARVTPRPVVTKRSPRRGGGAFELFVVVRPRTDLGPCRGVPGLETVLSRGWSQSIAGTSRAGRSWGL